MELILERLILIEEAIGRLEPTAEPTEAEPVPSFRFECKACRYRTNHSGDWKKHLTRTKHVKIAEKEREEAVKNDIFHKIRGKYPAELAGETDLDILTAYAWLQKFRMGSGAQAMCCQPLKSLWEAVHVNQFGGTYFMRGSKHMIHNTKLHRSLYTFEVFTKMYDAANCVLGEAKYLIEQRGRHEKYAHNQKNWSEFDLATAQSLPRFRNEKTNGQKRLNSMSLHEYLMSCH